MFGGYNNKKKLEEDRLKQQKEMQYKVTVLKRLLKESNVPDGCSDVRYEYGHPLINKKGLYAYIWADNENLYLHDRGFDNNIGKITIPIEDIIYLTKDGEVYRELQISGGEISGGGSSTKGAILGGIIAGDVGAVIGSRKEVVGRPITSQTITRDDRRTILYINIGDKKHSVIFGAKAYDKIRELIPEKTYEIYLENLNKTKVIPEVDNNIEIISNKIKQLSKLVDEGLVTEDEFLNKKAELLARI